MGGLPLCSDILKLHLTHLRFKYLIWLVDLRFKKWCKLEQKAKKVKWHYAGCLLVEKAAIIILFYLLVIISYTLII